MFIYAFECETHTTLEYNVEKFDFIELIKKSAG